MADPVTGTPMPGKSPLDQSIINASVAAAGGTSPTSEQQDKPPLGTVIPDWDQIKTTDTFQKADDQGRTNMLTNWYNQRRQEIDQLAQSDEERSLAQKHLDEQMDREKTASLERYSIPENALRDVLNTAATTTARVLREGVQTVGPAIRWGEQKLGIPQTPETTLEKPFRKLEKWTSENYAPPDAVWSQEHPFWHTFSSSIGGVLPFIAGAVGAEAVTGGAATPLIGAEAAGGLGTAVGWTADMAAQGIDMFQGKREAALAKIDDRRKHGEIISQEDGDRMATNDASMSLFGVPFMVASNMMVGRLVGHGMKLDTAQNVWNQFTKNVLLKGTGEFAGQVAIGTGVNALDALADQYSGVDKTGVTGETLKQGAWMGLGFGALGAVARPYSFLKGWRADQAKVNDMAGAARRAAEARTKVDPNANAKDVQEEFIQTQPEKYRNGIRAKLAQQDSSEALGAAAVTANAGKSPQLATELSKQADDAATETTVPVSRPYRKDNEKKIIDEMLANGHITRDQHVDLRSTVAEDPSGTMDRLSDMVKQTADRPNGMTQAEPTIFDLRRHAATRGPLSKEGPTALETEYAKLSPEEREAREVERQAKQDAADQTKAPPPPTTEGIPPTKEGEPPTKEGVPPTKEGTPPTGEGGTPPPPGTPPEGGAGTPPPSDPWSALQQKTKDYLGDATGEEKKDLATNFKTEIKKSGDPGQDRAADELMHQLALQRVGNQATFAYIKEAERQGIRDKFNQYLDKLTKEEGTLAGKPKMGGPISPENFFQMYSDNDHQGLHDQLAGGKTLKLKAETVEENEDLDDWLQHHNFDSDLVGDHYVIKAKRGEPGPYEKFQETLEELKEKRPAGRPLSKVWSPAELTTEYNDETKNYLEHPAGKEMLEAAVPKTAAVSARQGGDRIAQAAIARYERAIRTHAAKWRKAGREVDLQLKAKLIKAENLFKQDPDNKALEKHVEDLQRQVNTLAPLLDPDEGEHFGKPTGDPSIGQMITQLERDFHDHRKRAEKLYGPEFQGPWEKEKKEEYTGGGTQLMESEIEREEKERGGRVSEEEGEGEEGGESEEERAGFQIKPLSVEAERWQQIGQVDHQAVADEWNKTLRSNREKQALWHVVDKILGPGKAKHPEGLAALPNQFNGRKELLDKITNEYLRFLEKRESGRAGKGAAEGGEATATAAGGGTVPPAGTEEVPGGSGPAGPGGTGADAGTVQPTTTTTTDQGQVASGEPPAGGPRDTIAGLPESTSEGQGGPLASKIELLSNAPGGGDERAAGAGAPGAGRVQRDTATGERIVISPEGEERARSRFPTISRGDEERFQRTTDPLIKKTADSIWDQVKKRGRSDQANHLGLGKEDLASKAAVSKALKDIVQGIVKQEPSYERRVQLARDALRGVPPLKGEMSASQLRRSRNYANQTKPVTTAEQAINIVNQAWNKFEPGFRHLGIAKEVRDRKTPDAIVPLPNGSLVYVHSPQYWRRIADYRGITEGQVRTLAESMLEEELIHGAHLGMYRDEWARAGSRGNFVDYQNYKGAELIDSFLDAKNAAAKRKDFQTERALDKTFASAVKSYWGADLPGAEDIHSFRDFVNWMDTLDEHQQREVSSQLPYELARQLAQLDIFGRTTQYEDRKLMGKLHDWFMDSLRYMRRMALRVREGGMGTLWKDTLNTLEKRVSDLRAKMDQAAPAATPTYRLHQQTQELAGKLGHYFLDNPRDAAAYGLRFDDALHGPDYANKIIQKLKAKFGADPQTLNAALQHMARREGLTDEPRATGQPLYMGKMASLAPGVGESHVLDEGDTSRLARYLRASDDPEMRAFATTLTQHRDQLMGVKVRQLKHEVPAAFYHNGDLWVTEAALRHPDGHKAIANELQHSVAQEILNNPKTGEEHEVNAHATALTNQFKRGLPADIRDAIDNKFVDIFNHLSSTGEIDWDQINDQERKWFPLIQAASHPTEFIKKAFSSANFRDYLRSVKSDRGDPLWDNVHDWGRTLFGDQAFKFAPEASEVAYNRPGAVMREDPREGERRLSDPSQMTGGFPEHVIRAEQDYHAGKLHIWEWREKVKDFAKDIIEFMHQKGLIDPQEWWDRRKRIEENTFKPSDLYPQKTSLTPPSQAPKLKVKFPAKIEADIAEYQSGKIDINEWRSRTKEYATNLIQTAYERGYLNEQTYQDRMDRINNDAFFPGDLYPPTTLPPLIDITQKVYDRYAVHEGVPAMLDRIDLRTDNVMYKALAKGLKKILGENPGILVHVDPDEPGRGAYSLVNDVLTLSPFATDRELERTMLHEVVHSITCGKISAYLSGRFDLLKPSDFRAMQELEEIRRAAIRHPDVPDKLRQIADLGGYGNRGQHFVDAIEADPAFRKYYGLLDLHEFASEALTNHDFQQLLNKVRFDSATGERQTIFGKFFRWLSKFLGFKEGYGAHEALKNLATMVEGQRIMRSDFLLKDGLGMTTKGTFSPLMREAQLGARFLEKKATMEGYSSLTNVPQATVNKWLADWKSERNFQGHADPDKPQVVADPSRRGLVLPSEELSKKTDPEDILDHIARVTGIDHRDGKGLARAMQQAYLDKAITQRQYLDVQDVLKELNYRSLAKIKILGPESDPDAPKNRIMRWGRELLQQGNLPKELFKAQLEHLKYEVSALSHYLGFWDRKLNTLIKKHMGVDPLTTPARQDEKLNAVLEGKHLTAPEDMHPDLYNHLMEGRASIDNFSDRLRALGFIKEDSELYKEFFSNRFPRGEAAGGPGQYVARSQRIFHEPRFAQDTDPAKWNHAIPYMRKWWIDVQSKEAGDRAARKYRPGTSDYLEAKRRAELFTAARLNDSITDGMVSQKMSEMLARYRQTAEARDKARTSFGPAFVLNDSLLQEVTKLPDAFRELMGEEKDVGIRLIHTIQRQNQYLQTAQLAQEFLRAGAGKYFGDRQDATRNWTHQIPQLSPVDVLQEDGSVVQKVKPTMMGALAGKWTSREIHDVLRGYDALSQHMTSSIPLISSLENSSRYMTTMLSSRRGIANMWSGLFGMVQNGMLPTDARALRAAKNYVIDMFRGDSREVMRNIEEARRYGVLDKTTDPFTLRDMTQNGYKYMQRGPLDYLEGIENYAAKNKLWARIAPALPGMRTKGTWWKEAAELAQKFHVAGNDVNKMAQWYAKQKFVREANLEDVRLNRKDSMTGEVRTLTEDEIKRKAARIVNDTNISYSLTSPLVKRVRAQPFIGPFLTFRSEMLRSYANQWGYALNYLRSPNRIERFEGVRRAAGLMASAGFAYALAQTAMHWFGVSQREDDNLRKLLPPWEQNDVRIYGPMKDGKRQYMNLNYVMPQGDLARSVIAALTPNKDGIAGRIQAAMGEQFHPMVNFGLMPGALVDISRNQTEYGTQVYNPEDHWLRMYGNHPEGKALDMLNYAWTRWSGGTLGRAGRQLPQMGTTTKGGVVYDPNILLKSETLGQDLHEISIPDRFRSSLYSSRDELGNSVRIFTGPIQRNAMTDNDMRAAYQHMESVRRIIFGNLRDKIAAARDSGMTTTAIKSALKERRYSNEMINDLMTGRYHAYIPSKSILSEARKSGNHMPSGLFSKGAKNYEDEEQ